LSNAVEFDNPATQLVVQVLDDHDYALHFNGLAADFNPTKGIGINGGGGAEAVTIRNLGESFSAALAIDLGAGTDCVTFDGPESNAHRYALLELRAEKITQVNGATLTVTGATVLDNQGAVSALTLDDPDNDFASIQVTATHSPVTLRDRNSLEITAATIGGPFETASTELLIAGPVSALGATFRADTGTISGKLSAGAHTIHLLGGTFHPDGNDRIDNDSTLHVGWDAVFAIGGSHQTVHRLIVDGGRIAGTTGILTSIHAVEGRNGSVHAILAGGNGLNKTTNGTLILTASNTYTGQTTVSGGVLLVDGATAAGSAVSVENGATLGGSGTVGGTVTVADGGIVAPGSGPGVLQTGSITFVSGAFFAVQIDGTTVGAEYDRLAVNGGVSPENAALSISLGFAPEVGDAFTVIQNDGSDGVHGMFAGLPEGRVFTVATGEQTATFQITYQGGDGNDVVLTAIDPFAPVLYGTPGDDRFLVMRHGTDVAVYLDDTLIFSRDIGSITGGLTLHGGEGDDTLRIDYQGGDPVPKGGLFFHGGPGNDSMAIQGTGLESGIYQPSNQAGTDGKKGTVQVGASRIQFDGLEPLDVTGFASFTIDPAGAGDDLTVSDGFNLTTAIVSSIHTQPALVVSGTTGGLVIEKIAIWNVGTVAVNTAQTHDGDDAITIASGSGAHGINDLIIDTGAGNDLVRVIGALAVAGNIQVSSQNIQFAQDGTLTAGATNSVTLDAGAGAISRDGGNTLVHITAESLNLNATTGIEGPGLPIHTQVESLRADVSGAGSIYLDNQSGDITLTGVSAYDGSIKVLARNGTLTVAGTVTATGGDVLLQALGEDLAVNATVTATAGNASLLASGNVTQSAVAVTAGGTLDVEAQGGSITMADGATGSAVGNVRYLASQNVTLGGVSGANVRIEATGGSIIDGGDADTDVTASTVQLMAGVSVGAPAAGAIDTRVTTLAALAGTASIYVSDASNLTVGSVGAIDVQRVAMDSTTATLAGALLGGAVGDQHVKIEAAASLTVSNPVTATANDLLLQALGGHLAVNAAVTATAGSLSLLASGNVTQAAAGDVTAGGHLDVEATSGPITMDASAVSTAAGSNLRYRAAGDIRLGHVSAANVLVESSGGSILASAAPVNVTATTAAQLRAWDSIGAAGADALDTAIVLLAAVADNGGIYLRQADTLQIGTVGAIEVHRVDLDSNADATNDGSALSGVRADANLKIQVTTGDLTVSQAVEAGNGDLLLRAVAGNVIVNATVDAGGHATLLASGSVSQGAAGEVTVGGHLDVEATSGPITMDASAVSTAAGSNLRYRAAGDITLGHVSAANVLVESSGGSILASAAPVNVTATTAAQLRAWDSIGAAGADALDTAIVLLAAVADNGSIYLRQADTLQIGTVGAIEVHRVDLDSNADATNDGSALSGVSGRRQPEDPGDDGRSDGKPGRRGRQRRPVAACGGRERDRQRDGRCGRSRHASGQRKRQPGRRGRRDGRRESGRGGDQRRDHDGCGGRIDGSGQQPAVPGGGPHHAGSRERGQRAGREQRGFDPCDRRAGERDGDDGRSASGVGQHRGRRCGRPGHGDCAVGGRGGQRQHLPPGVGHAGDRDGRCDRSESGGPGQQCGRHERRVGTERRPGGRQPEDPGDNGRSDGKPGGRGGNGDLLLRAVAGNVGVNATVTATAGNASLLASANVTQSAVAVTAGGTLDVEAMGGSITMADGATGSAVGNVRYLASQNVTLGGVSGANVRIEATGGSIIDGGDADTDVTAGTASWWRAVRWGLRRRALSTRRSRRWRLWRARAASTRAKRTG
jgi:autotransporter-associated beta strand protein